MGTLDHFRDCDPKTYDQILAALAHWDDIEVHYRGSIVRSGGHGFSGIRRHRLLDILAGRAQELGVRLHYEAELQELPKADCVVAADGVNSLIRQQYAEFFKPEIDRRRCKFVWFGTEQIFESFNFLFKETEFGWFQAHCYQFDREMSTFIWSSATKQPGNGLALMK